jgi:2-desacetyl-2-hydroxyethyl bacteriochlorophyllide A dehydrogenase
MKNKKVYVNKPWEISLVEEESDLRIESPNDVILKNKYSHISAGTELACVSGIEGWFVIPNTPGYTAVAEVIEKGTNVQHVEKGDVVYTFGPHQQWFKIDITDRWHGVCVNVPDGLEPDIASFTHMAGIAMTSLRASAIELGDVVVVAGLGAIGNFAAQMAQLQGATVIASDINNSRIKIARECGIRNIFNPMETDTTDAILSFAGREKVDCWIDASGSAPLIEQALDHIVPNGEMILLGSPRKEYLTNLVKTLQKIHLLDAIKIKSALEFTFPTHQNDFSKHSIERNSAIIMGLMKNGSLKVKPFYTHKVTPEEAPSAYFGLRDKPDEYVGVVIDWAGIR